MGLKEIVADSWENLIEGLFKDCWLDNIQRYRSTYAFRGLSDKEYSLITSLVRLGGPYETLETHLLKNFRKYARLENSAHFTEWDWLTIAQHHGLPTRLLDWTFSPFVAMHFATCDRSKFDRDGAIWLVDFSKVHKIIPRKFREKLSEGSYVFTVSLLSQVTETLKDFDGTASGSGFALFFEPP